MDSFMNLNRYEKVAALCHKLQESDVICGACYTELKSIAYRAIVTEPTIFMRIPNLSEDMTISLHASCITHLLVKSLEDNDENDG